MLRSIICNCASRSRAVANPTKPNPALLTTNCGSAPCAASVSPICRAAPAFSRSHPITIGLGAPVAAISSASSRNLFSRRATSANSWPCRVNTRASATPIPAEAPVIRVTGRGFVMPSSYPRTAGRALFKILARREVAREHRLLNELLRIERPELAHLRIGLDDGVGELSVHPCHFANMDVEDRRAVSIEPHRADRAMGQADIMHRLEEGRRIVDLAARCFQRLLDDQKRGVRTGGIEAGIVLVSLVDAGNEFLVVRCVESCGVPASGEDANPFLAHHPQNALVGAGGVAEHGNFSLQSEVAELLEETQWIAPR